jgi:single-strand DNA-binding protein
MLNKCFFIGNLTKDPEFRVTPGGDAVCNISIALNRTFKDESGQSQTRTTYANRIEVWGKRGEACAKYLTKGSRVHVECRFDLDQWEDKESGDKRSAPKFVAEGEGVTFLDIKDAEPAGGEGAQQAAPPAPAKSAPGGKKATGKK